MDCIRISLHSLPIPKCPVVLWEYIWFESEMLSTIVAFLYETFMYFGNWLKRNRNSAFLSVSVIRLCYIVRNLYCFSPKDVVTAQNSRKNQYN